MPSTTALKNKKQDDFDNLGVKLVVLLIFAAFIGLVIFAFSQKKKSSPKKVSLPKENVLGTGTKGPVEDVTSLGHQAEATVIGAVQDVQKATGQVLGTATGNVASFVVQNAGESIFSQIEKLPQKQQEEIKQKICK